MVCNYSIDPNGDITITKTQANILPENMTIEAKSGDPNVTKGQLLFINAILSGGPNKKMIISEMTDYLESAAFIEKLNEKIGSGLLSTINQYLQGKIAYWNNNMDSICGGNYNIYGKNNNHIDPLDFNGKLTASKSKKSSTTIIKDLLTLKGHASASAGINTLHNLRSLRIKNLNIKGFSADMSNSSLLNVDATIAFTLGSLTGDGDAGCSVGFTCKNFIHNFSLNINPRANVSLSTPSILGTPGAAYYISSNSTTFTIKIGKRTDAEDSQLSKVKINDFDAHFPPPDVDLTIHVPSHISGVPSWLGLSKVLRMLASLVNDITGPISSGINALYSKIIGQINGSLKSALNKLLNSLE